MCAALLAVGGCVASLAVRCTLVLLFDWEDTVSWVVYDAFGSLLVFDGGVQSALNSMLWFDVREGGHMMPSAVSYSSQLCTTTSFFDVDPHLPVYIPFYMPACHMHSDCEMDATGMNAWPVTAVDGFLLLCGRLAHV